MKMTKIEIGLLTGNPYRNTELNPIDPHQVSELAKSYRNTGDFGVLPARKVGDHYEIACGHHRLRAMQKLGFTHADCKIASFSDDEMIMLMAAENATQHGGKPASQSDTVAAVIQRIGSWMFLSDNAEHFNEMAAKAMGVSGGNPPQTPLQFTIADNGGNGFGNAKASLTKTGAVSSRMVESYLDGLLNRDVIKSVIHSLVDDGQMRNVISRAKADADAEEARIAAIDSEREAKAEAKRQAEEAAAIKAAAAAQKAAEIAAKRMKEAEKAKAEAVEKQAKADAARKERIAREAVRKAEEEQAKGERRAKARAAMAERQAAEREESIRLRELRERQAAAALKAQEEAAENAVIDHEVRQLVANQGQYRDFRQIVKGNPSQLGRGKFGQAQFLKSLASQMRAEAPAHLAKESSREDKEFLSADRIKAELLMQVKRMDDLKRQAIDERKQDAKNSSLERQVERDLKNFFTVMAQADTAVRAIHGHLQDPRAAEMIVASSYSSALPGTLRGLKNIIPETERLFNMYVATIKNDSALAIDGLSNVIDIN